MIYHISQPRFSTIAKTGCVSSKASDCFPQLVFILHLGAINTIVFPLALTPNIIHNPSIHLGIFDTLVPLSIIGIYVATEVAGNI